MKRYNRGQVSVFLGMSLLIIISLLAFVINVGLFVKAKINLQNAVDAAAYAGAAAQARQLTNIGYLNYELRNNYKEWLFKYYVVGQISNENATGTGADGTAKEFRASSIPLHLDADEDAFDKFNVPRVCINLNASKNICQVYGVPGIPRFEASGLPVISELTNEFTNAAVAAKSSNCSQRSNLNFSTTLTWTYGNGDGTSIGTELDLMNDRVGVWPKAIELGIRMRNLESIVNRPPINGICRNKSPSAPGCEKSVTELLSEAGDTPINERPVNAFMSAYRNLGGGTESINQGADHLSMKNTLVITELSPQTTTFNQGAGLSGFLIPKNSVIGTEQYNKKYYLDLKVVPINYMIYFTSFVSETSEAGGGISAEGSCASSITGIPVPFLITGFIKNPSILTYYAVKGEAKYTGLFFPFTKTQGLTLKAYAAAKPFGGRIGPALFSIEGDKISSQSDNNRSFAYIAGIKASSTEFRPGMPIPFPNGSSTGLFITSKTDTIGGVPAEEGSPDEQSFYGLPNMIYDIAGDMTAQKGPNIFFIEELSNKSDAAAGATNNKQLNKPGLYDHAQFSKFQNNFKGATVAGISKSLVSVKTPTTYEALNYLIPSVDALGEKVATVQGNPNPSLSGSTVYNLFAPLCGERYLLKCDPADIVKALTGYLKTLERPVDAFNGALNEVAQSMREDAQNQGTDPAIYEDAADGIHPPGGVPFSPTEYINIDPAECDSKEANSLANKFNFFFKGGLANAKCGILPLENSLNEYFGNNLSGSVGNTFKNFVAGLDYVRPSNSEIIYSAFRPGQRSDVTLSSGEAIHPITGQKFGADAKRNFYSTKFIAINKVLSTGVEEGDYGKQSLYNDRLEGNATPAGANISYPHKQDIVKDSQFLNKLNAADLSEFAPMDTAF